MVKRLLGKAYKSTIMQRKQRMFAANIEDTPGFKQYLTRKYNPSNKCGLRLFSVFRALSSSRG